VSNLCTTSKWIFKQKGIARQLETFNCVRWMARCTGTTLQDVDGSSKRSEVSQKENEHWLHPARQSVQGEDEGMRAKRNFPTFASLPKIYRKEFVPYLERVLINFNFSEIASNYVHRHVPRTGEHRKGLQKTSLRFCLFCLTPPHSLRFQDFNRKTSGSHLLWPLRTSSRWFNFQARCTVCHSSATHANASSRNTCIQLCLLTEIWPKMRSTSLCKSSSCARELGSLTEDRKKPSRRASKLQ